jgi:hypothetical protein
MFVVVADSYSKKCGNTIYNLVSKKEKKKKIKINFNHALYTKYVSILTKDPLMLEKKWKKNGKKRGI